MVSTTSAPNSSRSSSGALLVVMFAYAFTILVFDAGAWRWSVHTSTGRTTTFQVTNCSKLMYSNASGYRHVYVCTIRMYFMYLQPASWCLKKSRRDVSTAALVNTYSRKLFTHSLTLSLFLLSMNLTLLSCALTVLNYTFDSRDCFM